MLGPEDEYFYEITPTEFLYTDEELEDVDEQINNLKLQSDTDKQEDCPPDDKREDEQLPNASEEFLSDFPSVFHVQRAMPYRFEGTFLFQSEGCNHSSGESCRWRDSPSRSRVLTTKVKNSLAYVLRLYCWETWELPDDEGHKEEYSLRLQGRSGADDLWRSPEYKLDFRGIQVQYCCNHDSIWLFTESSGYGTSWLFFIKPRKDSKVSVFLYRDQTQRIVSTALRTYTANRLEHRTRGLHKVVEYEFILSSKVQTMSIMDLRTGQQWKDLFDPWFVAVLQSIPYSEWGGFLRLFRK